ncbi:MAG: site-specific integrase [Acidimicrobiia bacterium]
MATVQADLVRGEWTDPRLSKTTLAEWSQRWMVTKSHLKPKTLAGYRSNLNAHVLPTFGDYQIRHIDRMEVEEWLADLRASGLGPSGVRQARQVLHAMLTLAVDAGYLTSNPVDGTSTPRLPNAEMLFLDADQVDRLASTIQKPYGTLVYVLAYGGLRWGEAAALRRQRCDLAHSRIEVAESLADVGGHLHFGPTKNHRSRNVAIPGFLRDLLDQYLASHVPDDPSALVFTTPAGTPLRNSNFRRQVWYQAVEAAGLPEGLRIHDLRHTCASLLAAAGATPKAIQVHLGHSSITVTMDRYTHLFPSDVDDLVKRLDDIRTRNAAAPPRPKDRSRGIELGGR